MTHLPPLEAVAFERSRSAPFGGLGDAGTRLLSGPPATADPEPLASHLSRFGRLDADSLRALLPLLRQSRLDGRGGGGFPVAKKLDAARLAGGVPLVVVNASESEPASRKDVTLVTHRPHLVLDGAVAIAAAVGSSEVFVHLHRGSLRARRALHRAINERRSAGLADPRWQLSEGPEQYVAGEAGAVASLLAGGEARPRFSTVPLAEQGPSGRPTVVNNAETVAHVAFLAHRGQLAWQEGTDPSSPGPRLVTLVGGVDRPGTVIELVGQACIGDLLAGAGLRRPPAAVLVGGYAGTWVDGWVAWHTPLDREGLERVGARPGCGLLGVLPAGRCGLVETARLVGYLAAETAGQCGPCVHGLPHLVQLVADLAAGTLRRRGLRRLVALADSIEGGGACHHPDGAVNLVRSALVAFPVDATAHLDGSPCPEVRGRPCLPLPEAPPSDRGWR